MSTRSDMNTHANTGRKGEKLNHYCTTQSCRARERGRESEREATNLCACSRTNQICVLPELNFAFRVERWAAFFDRLRVEWAITAEKSRVAMEVESKEQQRGRNEMGRPTTAAANPVAVGNHRGNADPTIFHLTEPASPEGAEERCERRTNRPK